jgi:uncharacterized protein (DUF983 family)
MIWSCPNCGILDRQDVTYEETCDHCGAEVTAIETATVHTRLRRAEVAAIVLMVALTVGLLVAALWMRS